MYYLILCKSPLHAMLFVFGGGTLLVILGSLQGWNHIILAVWSTGNVIIIYTAGWENAILNTVESSDAPKPCTKSAASIPKW